MPVAENNIVDAMISQDDEQNRNIDQLNKWVNQVRSKKTLCLRRRKRDFRIEAVLTNTLNRAENELRCKQIARDNRWAERKQQLLQTINEIRSQYNIEDTKYDSWSNPCPELDSFNDFMAQLNAIKIPIKR